MKILVFLILIITASVQAEIRKTSICSVLLGSRSYQSYGFLDRNYLHRHIGEKIEVRYGYMPTRAEPGYHEGPIWVSGEDSYTMYLSRESIQGEIVSYGGQLYLRTELFDINVLDIYNRDGVDYLVVRRI